MNGVFVVVALVAMSGLLVSGAAVGQEKVQAGPNTFESGKRLLAEMSVFEMNVNANRNIGEQVPASQFAVGSLTDNSLVVSSINVNSTGHGYTVVGSIAHLNQTFTFIQAFDTSNDGNHGGFVTLIDGGVGTDEFVINVQPLSLGYPMHLYIAAYAVDEVNGGSNFRVGTFRAGLELLSWSALTSRRNPMGTHGLFYETSAGGEIVYLQSRDLIEGGIGGTVNVNDDLIGSNHLDVEPRSGSGENLYRTFEIYGIRS